MPEFKGALRAILIELLIYVAVYLGIATLITLTGPWFWQGLPTPFYRWPLAVVLTALAAPPLAGRVYRWLS